MRSALVAIALLAGGCAELEDEVDASLGGGRMDALIGFTNDAATPAAQPEMAVPAEMGVAPMQDQFVPPDAAPGPCTPGAVLGQCEVCNEASERVAPERDESCPAVDCTPFNVYQLGQDANDGLPICELISHNPRGPNCAAVGRCREADATLCLPSPGVRVAAAQTECQIIAGCDGGEAPELGPAPAGTPCQGDEGLCAAGGGCDTTISEECGGYQGVALICGAGVHPTQGAYCAVGPVDPADHCAAFCSGQNTTCAAGYEAAQANSCVVGDEIGCLTPAAHLVCYCRR